AARPHLPRLLGASRAAWRSHRAPAHRERHDRAEPDMSGFAWPEGRGKWSVWRFHWLIHHKIIRALERARPFLQGTLLDVGCGTKPFAPVFESGLSRYWGLDLPDSRSITDPAGGRRPGRH